MLFGTPERTLTSDLPLRRRMLYTTELLGRISYRNIVTKNFQTVNKTRGIFSNLGHILSSSLFERRIGMPENDENYADVDDLIFQDEEYSPSER